MAAATSEARALPFFTDLYGQPLESGFIYIGQAGLDPVAYPAVVTSDIAGTVVVAQPVRTTHGHAVAAGAQIHLFCQVPYSITILDAAGRIIYASLNETDPVAIAVSSSSVQSAADFPTLRARSGSSTNQVYVTNVGMYVYVPTDNTSPENLPFVVVGNDGSRYYLNLEDGNFLWAKVSGQSANPITTGMWLSWNEASDSASYITNNRGSGLAGGFVFRNVNNSATETGRITIGPTGSITSGGPITSGIGDIRAAGNLYAQTGIVGLLADGSRSLAWDSVNSRYVLVAAPLLINGSLAMTQASLLANQQANGVGAVALGNNVGPNPSLPGTWSATGTSFNTVFLWVRTA